MKRITALILAMTFLLSACIPMLPSLQGDAQPLPVDVGATDDALAATLAIETLNALPTPTLIPVTDTPEPTSTHTETSTPTETGTGTFTATTDPNATVTETPTGTLATATITGTPPTATNTVTGTPPTVTQSATPTFTETPHAIFYGTLPPNIPYGKVKLINKSKVQVYVSLQCTTVDGYTTILEYPVEGRMGVSAPAGKYSYVAWVGGRQFLGSFSLGKGGEATITFEKTKVTVK